MTTILDSNYNADYLDAMADIALEQQEAMRLDEYLTEATEEIMAENAYHQEQAMREEMDEPLTPPENSNDLPTDQLIN